MADPWTWGRLIPGCDIAGERRPRTHAERVTEWDRRMEAYTMQPYRAIDIATLNLFIHVNEDDNVEAVTRRLSTDIRWCVDVDAASIASDALTLQIKPERIDAAQADEILAAAQRAWADSRIDAERLRYARNVCIYGEGEFETLRRPDGSGVVVWRDPQTVQIIKDSTGTVIETAVVDFPFERAPMVDPATGAIQPQPMSRYTRVLTRDEVRVYIDGALVADQSGQHSLGEVPIQRVTYADVGDGSLAEWSGAGMRGTVAVIDSIATQLQVIGARHASPLLAAFGARIASGADVTGPNKTISMPLGADLRWLEPVLSGLEAVIAGSSAQRDAMRATKPQFMFTEAGQNASGTALSNRATAFTLMIRPVRESFYSALSKALSMAAAINMGVPWTPAMDILQIDGGSPLPLDETAWVQIVDLLVDKGLLLRVDAVRFLQGLGIVPQGDPEEYAAALESEGAAATAVAVDGVKAIVGAKATAPEVATPAGAPVADTALNGAQIQAAQAIVQAVVAGMFPRDAALGLLRRGFQLDDAGALDLLGSAGAGFRPAAPEPVPAAPAPAAP